MKAALRQTRISLKKANLIAGIVRGKKVNEALSILKFIPKKGAKILYKVIHSATSNAKHNFNVDRSLLTVKSIRVDKGPTLKRSRPRSRGMSSPIKKRSSHITLIMETKNI